MGPTLDTAFVQHFHSKMTPPKGVNASMFENSELDRLLEEGARTVDETKMGAIYRRVQDILNDEIPWLPIYVYMDFLVVKKGVKGVEYPGPFRNHWVSKDAEVR